MEILFPSGTPTTITSTKPYKTLSITNERAKQFALSVLKPQNRQKIIIRIIDKIKIYYSIDFVDYSILSITIICRIIDKKMEHYTCGLV